MRDFIPCRGYILQFVNIFDGQIEQKSLLVNVKYSERCGLKFKSELLGVIKYIFQRKNNFSAEKPVGIKLDCIWEFTTKSRENRSIEKLMIAVIGALNN